MFFIESVISSLYEFFCACKEMNTCTQVKITIRESMHNTYYTEHKMSELYLKPQKAMFFVVLKIELTYRAQRTAIL